MKQQIKLLVLKLHIFCRQKAKLTLMIIVIVFNFIARHMSTIHYVSDNVAWEGLKWVSKVSCSVGNESQNWVSSHCYWVLSWVESFRVSESSHFEEVTLIKSFTITTCVESWPRNVNYRVKFKRKLKNNFLRLLVFNQSSLGNVLL